MDVYRYVCIGTYVCCLGNIYEAQDLCSVQQKEFAIKRQPSLERKFAKNINLAIDNKFMQEYKEMGHMSLTIENQHPSQSHFFLPHHAVIKEESTTTKLRIVFDGSSKSSTGISLNDIQGAGSAL
ncbi:hypothetical protein Trydic_g5825 [Trypoxylus dichotomus]